MENSVELGLEFEDRDEVPVRCRQRPWDAVPQLVRQDSPPSQAPF